jgi:hypothetical protein
MILSGMSATFRNQGGNQSSDDGTGLLDASPPRGITSELIGPSDQRSRPDDASRSAVSGDRSAFRVCCANASRNAATTRTTSSFARRLGWAPKAPSLAEWFDALSRDFAESGAGQSRNGSQRPDGMGVIRDPADNDIHVIPAWEYDVTEDEFKKSMAETTVSSSSH